MDKIILAKLDNFERNLWRIFLLLGGDPTISTTEHITLEEE